jgi:hypothetical protein
MWDILNANGDPISPIPFTTSEVATLGEALDRGHEVREAQRAPARPDTPVIPIPPRIWADEAVEAGGSRVEGGTIAISEGTTARDDEEAGEAEGDSEDEWYPDAHDHISSGRDADAPSYTTRHALTTDGVPLYRGDLRPRLVDSAALQVRETNAPYGFWVNRGPHYVHFPITTVTVAPVSKSPVRTWSRPALDKYEKSLMEAENIYEVRLAQARANAEELWGLRPERAESPVSDEGYLEGLERLAGARVASRDSSGDRVCIGYAAAGYPISDKDM